MWLCCNHLGSVFNTYSFHGRRPDTQSKTTTCQRDRKAAQVVEISILPLPQPTLFICFLPDQPWLWEIPNWQYAAGRPPLAMSLLPIDSPLRWLSTTMSPAVHGRTSCGHSCAAALVLATVVSQRIDYHWSRLPLLLGSSPAPPRSFFGHHPSRPISPTQSFNRWCRTTFVTVVTESTD